MTLRTVIRKRAHNMLLICFVLRVILEFGALHSPA